MSRLTKFPCSFESFFLVLFVPPMLGFYITSLHTAWSFPCFNMQEQCQRNILLLIKHRQDNADFTFLCVHCHTACFRFIDWRASKFYPVIKEINP